MSLIPAWLRPGNDRELAKTYPGLSATDRARGKAAKRTARNLLRHHNGGMQRTANQSQQWEDEQREFGGRP
jgi:hypothetical protein